MSLTKFDPRHPSRPLSRVALSEEAAERQIARGIYEVSRGERYAIPVDDIHALQDGRRGFFGAKTVTALTFLNRDLWRRNAAGQVYRPGTQMEAPGWDWVPQAWRAANRLTGGRATHYRNLLAFGHDVHVTTYANLFGRHWHRGWANPFEPENFDLPIDLNFKTFVDTHKGEHDCRLEALGLVCPKGALPEGPYLGFIEDLGWLSGAKVTDAFVSEEIDELVSTTGTEYADFDSHEVGTSTQVESNDDTALIVSSGIARAAGTPTDSDPIYQSVATVTADVTESWEEHALFNNTTGAAMMDRNLTGGQSVNSSDIVEYTYQLTKAPEA